MNTRQRRKRQRMLEDYVSPDQIIDLVDLFDEANTESLEKHEPVFITDIANARPSDLYTLKDVCRVCYSSGPSKCIPSCLQSLFSENVSSFSLN